MRLSLILICLILTTNFLKAQPEFGRVSDEDFEITFKGEEDAPAIILSDVGTAEFRDHDNGFRIHFKRTTRIKINTKEGLKYGEVIIPLYADGYNRTEYAEDIQGFTYYKDDGIIKRVPLGVDQIFEEEYNDTYNVKKFAMPAVRENSIIEYTYTTIIPSSGLPDWEFQSDIPTIYSSYKVALIPFYEYSYRLQGASRFDYHNSEVNRAISRSYAQIEYNDMLHTYVMKNIPSFKDESFITSKRDYIMKLDFQLAKIIEPYGGTREFMTTWEKLNEQFLKHEDYGKFFNHAGRKAKEIVERIPLGANKMEWVVNYIRENYSWNGYFGQLADVEVKEFTSTRTGNATAINLFMCAVLNEAGIVAKPVLISTRNHGKVHLSYPFANQFNSSIVLVEAKEGFMLTDGTEKYIPYNTIPPMCINGQGLVVDKNAGNFISLAGFNSSQTLVNLSLTPDPEKNVMVGGIVLKASGYDSYQIKKKIDAGVEEYEKEVQSRGILTISDVSLEDKNEAEFQLKYMVTAEIEKLGNELLISPFLGWPPSENPLKSKSRKYPVDMIYSNKNLYLSQVAIPEGYTPEELPEEYNVDDDLVKISYTCRILGSHIVSQGEVTFKKSVYESSEYGRLRAHYAKVVDVLNTQIILIKN